MLKTVLTIFLVFFFFLTDSQWAFGDQNSSIEKELRREKRELNRIKSKLGTEKEKIKRERKREKSTLEILGNINKKLNAYKIEQMEYNNKLDRTNKDMSKIEAEIIKNREKIQIQKTLLQKRLRVIYKEGEPAYFKVVFSAADPNDFLQRLKYMKIIANLDAELISHYKADIEKLTATKKELRGLAKKVALYKKFTQKKKNEILNEKKKKQKFLYKIRTRKSSHEKTQKELFEASKELNALITLLEKSYLEEKSLTFPRRKGFLPWPVRGRIISSFGKVKNKLFQTYAINNGIEIAAPIGKNVHAIHGGEVLHSGNLKGYGLMVILGHGKGYYSLYAHLNESFVKKGDTVEKSQVFARTGDSDSINGPSLYFEIRNKRIPENPLKWLSAAKK